MSQFHRFLNTLRICMQHTPRPIKTTGQIIYVIHIIIRFVVVFDVFANCYIDRCAVLDIMYSCRV